MSRRSEERIRSTKLVSQPNSWRCAAARKRLQKNHYRLHCTVKAQRLWRVYCRVKHCRNAYMFVCHRLVRKRVAAVKIQKFWRLHHHFKKYMSSTIRIQSFFRGVKGKIKLYARRSRAFVRIPAQVRAWDTGPSLGRQGAGHIQANSSEDHAQEARRGRTQYKHYGKANISALLLGLPKRNHSPASLQGASPRHPDPWMDTRLVAVHDGKSSHRPPQTPWQ